MKRTFKAVIVDDERLARNDLRSMLSRHPELEIVGEADSVSSAARIIRKKRPDVVFLDIWMPGESGFDLLERIVNMPRIVFVTAFDEYAVRAFQVNALDYLLKPVNPDRLALTVQRLLDGVRAVPASRLEWEDRVFVQSGNRYLFVKVGEIELIEASGDYSEVTVSGEGAMLISKSMAEWEAHLPTNEFLRIHRSAIVNFHCIEKIESWTNRSYRIHLRNKHAPLIVSRRYASKIRSTRKP